MLPARKIASNHLLTPDGRLVAHPLVELNDEGLVVHISTCATPDREPFTEFYAGLLVVGLDERLFALVSQDTTTPITTLLPPLIDPQHRRLVLLTGIHYETMTLTERSRIRLF